MLHNDTKKCILKLSLEALLSIESDASFERTLTQMPGDLRQMRQKEFCMTDTSTHERIPLSSLKDILAVKSDADFEQILAELPDDLRQMRQMAQRPGHKGFSWPISWRRSGAASTITTHCPDGSMLPRPLKGATV